MKGFRLRSLMGKLTLFFLIAAWATAAVVGYLCFNDARSALRQAVLTDLHTSNIQARQALIDYLGQNVRDLRFVADTWSVQTAFEVLGFYEKGSETAQEHTVTIGSNEYKKIVAEIAPLFKKWLKIYGEQNAREDLLIIVGEKRGRIMYTEKGLKDLGLDLTAPAVKDSSLVKLWAQVTKTKKPAMVDFSFYQPAEGPAMFVGVPVFAEGQRYCGVLVVRLGPQRINAIAQGVVTAGATGESFLVGEDYTMRSTSRLRGAGILKEKRTTEAAKRAFQGKEGIGILEDDKGASVLNSWLPIGLKGRPEFGADFSWGLIAKIDASEAFAPIRSLMYRVIMIAICIGVVAVVLAFLFARTIANPITTIASKAMEASAGDLTVEIPELKRKDELVELANAFREMLGSFRNQIEEVLGVVHSLSGSASQISSVATEVSASTSETAASVAQATSTAEQVRQAAQVSNENAREVADRSNGAVKIAQSGRQATEDTIRGMQLIKGQMESIGETVVRLSEHSQAIEQIVATVTDLADQSNLLAVNASIEAARAGEHGKGFSVVANEIKMLAGQSREATEQVRVILEDTRKSISAVVMATEQGGKAVGAGVSWSEMAGKSIESLESSVVASSEAAAVIQASSEQQALGVTQVSSAMTSINEAVRQNLTGMAQIEDAAQKLDALSAHLKRLVERYTV